VRAPPRFLQTIEHCAPADGGRAESAIIHPLQQITARSLRVAVVAFVVIIVIFFTVVFVFLFFLVWLLSKQDIGTYRQIEGGRIGVFWMFSAHI
jgi:heme/copper-type cytochrome/quinol oxidase subunit 2